MSSGVNVAFSNLRAVVILIVVAFHSALPYLASQPPHPFAFDTPPYRWIAFPIIDRERWFGFDLFCAWQDISLMSLMFFMAGLFTPQSLIRKGSVVYLAERCWRIGVPFALAAAILSPLAYYASYRVTAADPSVEAFWQHWRALPMWPTGPQWFLWQLLLLGILAAALQGLAPSWRHAASGLVASCNDRPLLFFAGLTGLSVVAYVPLAMIFTPWEWTFLGPFSFQLSRPLHYLIYFLTAFAIGSHGCDRSVLRCDGPIARHWLAWLAAAIGCFALWGGLTSLTLPDWNASPLPYRLAAAFAFPFACATGVLAFVAISLALLRARAGALDSLSTNAYGIYIVHYVFVLWLQYWLLAADLNAVVKAGLVFVAALALSWTASSMVKAGAKPLVRRHAEPPVKSAIANQPR
ncbi:acyltransferase [Bradyrhizobium sp. ISRA443]|uniref:acyltransferase family protein n=1 Tax=unclassified Bradyrhizobium TaxID=2631580 RepID=UPI002478529F|nr:MULTISPECIES: acyltransferase family protein [unclassified Bradyrhizobium]WGS02510.1 acyltransferase [Bradyrhizobium sp. ISRA436]WGS09395.1 acyltransferase [Bradyrhizobium sp. ISRA437]WGS16284.1 acyltransferase [Bradyrhizobium sp. ISRA443]